MLRRVIECKNSTISTLLHMANNRLNDICLTRLVSAVFVEEIQEITPLMTDKNIYNFIYSINMMLKSISQYLLKAIFEPKIYYLYK